MILALTVDRKVTLTVSLTWAVRGSEARQLVFSLLTCSRIGCTYSGALWFKALIWMCLYCSKIVHFGSFCLQMVHIKWMHSLLATHSGLCLHKWFQVLFPCMVQHSQCHTIVGCHKEQRQTIHQWPLHASMSAVVAQGAPVYSSGSLLPHPWCMLTASMCCVWYLLPMWLYLLAVGPLASLLWIVE